MLAGLSLGGVNLMHCSIQTCSFITTPSTDCVGTCCFAEMPTCHQKEILSWALPHKVLQRLRHVL